MDIVFYPGYFLPIVNYVALVKANSILLEVEDNYQKQTYRNRCYIYGTNGKQLLNIPVKHNNSSRKTKDVRIENSFNWQKQHIKSIQTAYRSSPYFEFYEEDILELYKKENKYLLDFNLHAQEAILELLQLEITSKLTDEYHKTYDNILDLRHLVNAKSTKEFSLQPYIQVFSDKNGFIANLSILDLLFMEGTNALQYLKTQKIKLN